MHVAVVTTAQPQAIASSKEVGTGLTVDVFKNTGVLLYSTTRSSTDFAGWKGAVVGGSYQSSSEPHSDPFPTAIVTAVVSIFKVIYYA